LGHKIGVHSNETTRQRFANEFRLNFDSLFDELIEPRLAHLLHKLGIQEDRELTVERLIAGNELVGEGEAGHKPALLHPINATERSAEEDPLDTRERYKTSSETAAVVVNPLLGPIGLLLDAREVLNCIE